jgi:hypothetical protein
MLLLLPAASVRPAQALSKTIFLSVGVEKAAEGYTVMGAVVVNRFTNQGEAENKVISAQGATIIEAFDKITANQGRAVSLAHCNLIVIGATLANENVAEVLEHFLVQFEMSNNALLVWTDADVGKVLEASLANKTDSAGGLVETIAIHNRKDLTLDKFYKDYLKGRDGYMNTISLEDDEPSNKKNLAVFREGLFKGISCLRGDRG